MFKSGHSQRSNNSSTKSSDVELTDDPKHWSNNIQETSISFSNGLPNGFVWIGGGAEFGEFCWVEKIKDEGGNLFFHSIDKFSTGDIILEVENQSVVGFTSYDLLSWLRIITKDRNIVSVKFVSPTYLTKDLKKFLNTRFQRHSLDHQLQHSIRLNVYRRTVPCTTRRIRESEIDGVDYRFLSIEEFRLLESVGGLLESGSYSGNFYGTPLPPKQEDAGPGGCRSNSSPGSRSYDDNHRNFRSAIEGPRTTNGELSVRTANLKLLDGSTEDGKRDEDDRDLPPGWEKVDSYPEFGVFYVDHTNKRTQFERPRARPSTKGLRARSREQLKGEFVTTRLVKGSKGFGFTIVGGDENNALLQIKTIISGGAAFFDQKLQTGDILVNVDGQEVLGFTYKEIVGIFQAIEVGTDVPFTVCRGYPLAFDPNDPRNKVITTVAVRPLRASGSGNAADSNSLGPFDDAGAAGEKNQVPGGIESIVIHLVRGHDGFRFTLSDVPGGQGPFLGQRVRSILDRSRCGNLREGDVIEKINSITVSRMTHNQVVEILKACPVGKETEFVILRGVPPSARSSSVTPSMERSPQISLNSDNYIFSRVLKPKWKTSSSRCLLSPEGTLGDMHFMNNSNNNNNNSSNDPRQFTQGYGRSKTPGPVLMKSQTVGEESEGPYGTRQWDDYAMPLELGLHSRSKSSSRPLLRNENRDSPDFVPAHHFTAQKFSEDANDFPLAMPSNVRISGSAYSSSSSTSATPVQIKNFTNKPITTAGVEEYQVFPVRLFRQAEGFGIKFGGGTEDGSSAVVVTHISPGGSSDLDGRVKVGDEVVSVNFTPVVSCRKANEALALAAAQGVVNLELRRAIGRDPHFPPEGNVSSTRDPFCASSSLQSSAASRFQGRSVASTDVREITLIKSGQQSFGFTIISSTAKCGSRICSIVPEGPAGRCGRLHVDDLLLAVNGVDVRSTEHESIVDLIRSSGSAVTLLVTSPGPEESSTSMSDVVGDNLNDCHPSQSHSNLGPEPLEIVKRLNFKQSEVNKRSFNSPSFDPFGGELKQTTDSRSRPPTFHFVEIKKGPRGFGFTISGGREYGEVPLSILKIAEDGPAARDGSLKVGDEIVEINAQNTSGMNHAEAIKAIVQSDSLKVALLVKRRYRDD